MRFQYSKDDGPPIALKTWNENPFVTVKYRYKLSLDLIEQGLCLFALQAAYADMVINIARFKYAFVEQFSLTHNMGILAGAHEARMMHGVFLRSNTVVMELQPEDVTLQRCRDEPSRLNLDC